MGNKENKQQDILSQIVSQNTLNENGLKIPIKRDCQIGFLKKPNTQLHAAYKKYTLNIKTQIG